MTQGRGQIVDSDLPMTSYVRGTVLTTVISVVQF